MPSIPALLSSMLLCVTTSAQAATLIDIKGKHNEITQIMTDGKMARMDMGGDGSYMLIDYAKNSIYAVLPEQRQIMDMGSGLPSLSGDAAQKVDINLAPSGSGPSIAGYATQKFTLRANGQYCGEMFGSRDALKDTGIAKLFDAMKTMVSKQREAMGGYASMIDPCTRASMNFESVAARVGVPMRMLDKNGQHVSEIQNINTNAKLPANAFVLPEGYQVVTVAEKVQQAQQAMEPLRQQMPQIENMLKQMQQQGDIPPEAMEQLQRYQQMMQQQQ